MHIRFSGLLLAAASALSLSACMTGADMDTSSASASTQGMVTVGGAPMYANRNIIQNAVNSGDHRTLVAAVQAAGLVETLSGPGPFTVFAPTDAAFAKLPDGTVTALLADKEKLTSILTFHVVGGKVMAADIVKSNGATPTTVNGLPL